MNKKRQIANKTGVVLTAISLLAILMTGLLYSTCKDLSAVFAIISLFASGFTFGTGQSLIILAFVSGKDKTKKRKPAQFNQKDKNDKDELTDDEIVEYLESCNTKKENNKK